MALLKREERKRDSSGDPEEFRATLGEHLDELRSRILRAASVLVIATIVAWFFTKPTYDFLTQIYRQNLPEWLDWREPFNSVAEPFMLKLKLAFYMGLTVACPYIVWELWGFVAPGLKPHERRPFKMLAPISVLLFFIGCSVGWFTLPSAIQWFVGFFSEFKGTSLYQPPGTMVFFIVKMLLAFGIAFELPLVTFFLAKVGILSLEVVTKNWKQVVVGVIVISATITPSGDPISMLAMAVPLSLLFFLSMAAVKLTGKKVGRDPMLDDLD